MSTLSNPSPPAPAWLPLPLALEQITAPWLSAALSVRHPGTEVTAIRFSNRRDGTSTSARLDVDYARPSELPATWYVKGGFVEAMRRRVWAGLEVEARFYAEVAPELRIHIPRGHFAGVDAQNRQAIVVLEDMGVRGVHFGHATEPIGAESMARLMSLLADLHAQWWQSPRLATLADGAGAQRLFVKYLLRPKFWSAVLDRPYAHLIPPALRDAGVVDQALDRMWALSDARTPTLVHGDTHAGNLFFEPDGTPGLMDWQCAQKAHWAHDVMWTIVCGMTIDERRRHERHLIEHYLAELARHGVAAPGFDEAWLAYRQCAMYGVSCGVANPYDMQNEEVTRTSAERILAAVEDLETARSLGVV